jgi:galactokinase
VAECAEAAAALLRAAGHSEVEPLLRHVSAADYVLHREKLDGPPARRAAHYFSEVERVQRGIEAWRQGDLSEFGRLITASGESSIRNYECGSEPLIDLFRALLRCEGVYGARFSGAGFRGCCVGLVAREAAAEVAEEVGRVYAARQPRLAEDASVAICDSGDGARFLGESACLPS